MKVPVSGAWFIPDKANPKKCVVKQILEVSLGGNIPELLMKAAIKD